MSENNDDFNQNYAETTPDNQTVVNTVRKKTKKVKVTKKRRGPHPVIYIISLLIFAGMVFHGIKDYQLIGSYTFLPGKYLEYFKYGFIGCTVFFAIFALLPVNNLNKILSSILCIALAFALAEVSIILPTYKGRLERAFVEVPTEVDMNINVYVLKESGIETIKDLAGKKVAIQTQLDLEYQEYALIVINKELSGQETIKVEYEDIYSTVEALYNKDVDAFMLNESYVEIVAENADFADFLEKTTLLYTCTKKITLEYDDTAVGDITTEPFVVMIGANDGWEYGNINRTESCGRTDVNLCVIIHPVTKQILIVTIPRDAYVNLWGNPDRPDKLTHSTVYSLNCWKKAVNDLLGVNINYYVRVNFSSLVNIINSLDGIDINNPYEFESTAIRYYDFETKQETAEYVVFKEGIIHLTGEHALGYVRERYHLKNGDFDRNKHQAIVLRGLIDRVTTVDGITHFGDLLEAVEGTFATDINMDQIYALAQMQLNDMASWNIQQVSISGYSTSRPCYAMGLGSGEFSVVIVDQNSVNTAKGYIQQVLNGETISVQ